MIGTLLLLSKYSDRQNFGDGISDRKRPNPLQESGYQAVVKEETIGAIIEVMVLAKVLWEKNLRIHGISNY